MKFPALNWKRGLWRIWLVFSVPWALFFISMSVVVYAGQAKIRSELTPQWCLIGDPTPVNTGITLPEGFTLLDEPPDATAPTARPDSPREPVFQREQNGTFSLYIPNSWGWCKSITPDWLLRKADGREAAFMAAMALSPLLVLAASLIAFKTTAWVGRGFRQS